MKISTCSRLAATLFAALLLASCAAPSRTDRVATPDPVPKAAETPMVPADTQAPAAPAADGAFATNQASPTTVPGADPTVNSTGVDPFASPEGFSELPPVLEKRAESRWKLLIAGKGDQAYDFLSAGVRSSLDREVYASDMRSRPVRWLSADALDGQCEGSTCLVRVLVNVKFKMQASGGREMETESVITERWIDVGGVWSHIPDEYVEGFTK